MSPGGCYSQSSRPVVLNLPNTVQGTLRWVLSAGGSTHLETEERYLSNGLNHFQIIFSDPCEEGFFDPRGAETHRLKTAVLD